MPLPKITTRFPVAELHGRCVALEALLSALLANQLASLDIELRLGDAGKIRAMEVRKQKTDRRDAQLLLQLLLLMLLMLLLLQMLYGQHDVSCLSH